MNEQKIKGPDVSAPDPSWQQCPVGTPELGGLSKRKGLVMKVTIRRPQPRRQALPT